MGFETRLFQRDSELTFIPLLPHAAGLSGEMRRARMRSLSFVIPAKAAIGFTHLMTGLRLYPRPAKAQGCLGKSCEMSERITCRIGFGTRRNNETQNSHSFPFSRLREKVPDRADEGVGSAHDSFSREENGEASILPTLAVLQKLREHPHPAFGHLLPQARPLRKWSDCGWRGEWSFFARPIERWELAMPGGRCPV